MQFLEQTLKSISQREPEKDRRLERLAMQAFREIVTPHNSQIKITLPAELGSGKVEVIVIPFQGTAKKLNKKKRLLEIFEQSHGTLPEGYRFDRDETHER